MKKNPVASGKSNPLFWGLALLLLFIAGCDNEISSAETYTKKGIVYQKSTDAPFTGTVVGKARDDYRQIRCDYRKQYKDGVLDGTTKYWYPGGQLESVEPYKMGQLNGMVTRYYRNGQVKARIDFVDGLRGGRRGEMYWTPTGKVKPG